MRTLEPANRLRIGLMGLVVTVLAVGVGQTFTSVPMLFASPTYFGQFTDTGQLNKGDNVRIAGVDVGQVQGIKIDGDHIVMKFSTGSNTIGTESRLAIKTDTILGKKVLEIEPRGTQTLRPGGTLPLGQSTTPYQIYDAFFDVTKAAAGWNIDTVKQSLNVLSQTIDQTYPHLSAALDGVAKFSDTIGKRDEQITHLLAQANQIASILGDRSQQIDRLFVNSNDLLAAFNERSRAISALLNNVSALFGPGGELHQRQPEPQPHAGAAAYGQRPTARSQGRPGTNPEDNRQNRRGAERNRRVGTVFQGAADQPAAASGSCSPGWTPRSRSAGSTPRSSGAALGCRRSGSPTPTAPGSPTVRRRRRRRRWKAPRITRGRPWRPDRRVPMRRRRTAAASREPDAVREAHKTGPFGPNGPNLVPPDVASSPPNPNGRPRHPEFRSRDGRAMRRRTCRARRCLRARTARGAHRAAGTRYRAPRGVPPGARSARTTPPGPAAAPGPGKRCRRRSSPAPVERQPAEGEQQGGSQN